MANKMMTGTYIYDGQTYGPGEVTVGDGEGEMPEDVAKALDRKGAFLEAEPMAAAPGLDMPEAGDLKRSDQERRKVEEEDAKAAEVVVKARR